MLKRDPLLTTIAKSRIRLGYLASSTACPALGMANSAAAVATIATWLPRVMTVLQQAFLKGQSCQDYSPMAQLLPPKQDFGMSPMQLFHKSKPLFRVQEWGPQCPFM
jgi:hypothetical protein